MSEKRLELVRGLGAWASAAIVVGTMIGTGIFLKPAEMAREGRTVSVVFAAWIVGAILSIFGAFSFAELGAAIPEAGGEYAYLRRAFGPVWGFLFGWMHSIVGRPSSLASISAGMMRFVGFLIPAVGAPIFTVHIVRAWRLDQAVRLCLHLGAASGGFVAGRDDWRELSRRAARRRSPGFSHRHQNRVGDHRDWGGIFFAGRSGACSRSCSGREQRQCRNNLRRVSRHTRGGFVGLRRLGRPESGRFGSRQSAAQFSARAGRRRVFRRGHLFVVQRRVPEGSCRSQAWPLRSTSPPTSWNTCIGRGAAAWITVAMAISALGSMNSSVLSGARVGYAMARDGIFFKIAGGIHPKFRTPGRALIFQGVLASLMALTGTFEELTNLFIFAGWIFYGFAVVALFRMRRTEPDLPRPYRCWGYPWVPGLFVAGALALTVNIWIQRPGRSTIGLLLILAGLPFYRILGSPTKNLREAVTA